MPRAEMVSMDANDEEDTSGSEEHSGDHFDDSDNESEDGNQRMTIVMPPKNAGVDVYQKVNMFIDLYLTSLTVYNHRLWRRRRSRSWK